MLLDDLLDIIDGFELCHIIVYENDSPHCYYTMDIQWKNLIKSFMWKVLGRGTVNKIYTHNYTDDGEPQLTIEIKLQ